MNQVSSDGRGAQDACYGRGLASRFRGLRMSTSTKLILTLTLVVGAVMASAGYALVRNQETALMAHRQSEVLAHAITLQLALDEAYRAGRPESATSLIDRLSENPKIEGVILYDERGQVAVQSKPIVTTGSGHLEDVQRVIETGETVERLLRIDDADFLSVIMPIRLEGGQAAFEIVEVTTFVKADIREARATIVVTTLVLFAMIFAVVVLVTRRNHTKPIAALLAGARALGGGEHGYRVAVDHGGAEFTELADEFNRMADRLAEQRSAAERDAEQRLTLERSIRHNERLALVGRLAAGVAHEMGAPLNVIDGRAAQILSQPNASLDRRQRNLTIIRTQTQRIARIVRQLLGLARPYDLRPVELDLGRLARSACDLVEPEASAAAVEILVSAPGAAAVVVDEQLVQQVLLNLCLNAVQAMPHGGKLRVEVLMESDGGEVLVRVSDSGPGISPDDLPQVFDPFFTTKDVGSGTGLGLSVSRRIIEEHGGRIEAANDPSGGAVFTVHLPMTVRPDSTAEEEVAEVGNTATGC